ncbi:Uncharacterised protein [Elizabethkingia miricola]|nr:class IIb bacteriocin, lactobin A/cerein 7B family [Elizabethkingia miricola]MCL1679354.1 class IIb bacteriocin, lactobin A/cerein 7B family [Elizabethkingia miricola]QCO47217.1 class IIb bacteriocin, lactobin A/cerein 7B family [Elizabethkingia sp. 2-6]WQM40135.1 class IIb bacteriocin, lactobin A/cerein 7B family [Elizabethkingia miricola]SPW30267.1 Uncharacterised protein [Elizabethkingia miricola]
MNLQNLNLVELNTQEMKKTEGGGLLVLPLVGFAWGYLYEKYVNK